MGHKKIKSDTTKPKRQLIRTTMEKKKEIVAKYESGVGVTDIALMFKMPRTTISTIVRNKEAIKAASVAKGVKSVSKQRSQTLEEVEKLLYIWINEKQLAGDSISEAIICEKARQLHADLLKDKPGSSGESTKLFKASHGWFDKFKKRTGIHSVVKRGEVNDKHIGELEEHRAELSTKELQELQNEQQQIAAEDISAGEEERREEASTALIKEMCGKWVEVQNFVEKYHPDKALASRNVDLINEQTMSHFRNILKHRQRQDSFDRLLVKLPKSESSTVFREAKRQKTEETQQKSPEIVLEGDSTSSTSPPSHYAGNSSQYRFFGTDTGSVRELDLTEQTPILLGSKAMATSLMEVASSFGEPTSPVVNRSRNSTVEDDDDDIVFIESIQPPSTSSAIADQRNFVFTSSRNEKLQGNYFVIHSSSRDSASQKGNLSETIVIDDEENIGTNGGEKKTSSSFIEWELLGTKNRTKDVDFSTSSLSRRKTKTGVGPFNPGRMNVAGDEFQNGGFATHPSPDSWISQSASFPRNQKQPGVDSLSPVALLPKQICQPSTQQQPTKPATVTCANCKNPLQKGQTAYQRKGSAHLFCSTTCLSSFSHKRTPKKRNVTCKKDALKKRAKVDPQVQSSQPVPEFCSAYCGSPYEDNQNLRKRTLNKSRCTICSKLTEIRHEVSVNNVTHKLCSNHCFNKYRLANGLIMNCCEQCGEYLPSRGAGNSVLVIDDQQMRFCCQGCVDEYKQTLETKSKKLSASENRKRNAVREKNERQLHGSFNILLEKTEGIPEKKEKILESQVSAECSTDTSLTRPDVNSPACLSTAADTFQEKLEEKKLEDSTPPVLLSADPGTWPRILNIKQQNILIENDPPQVRNFNFPKDNTGRKFSETYYTRILPNGEKTTRSWLLYSTSKDSVFCLYCKLFGEGKNQLKNENGCKDWQHLSHILSKHEESEMHINNSVKYSKLKSDLKRNDTVGAAEHREPGHENSEGVLLLYT